MIRSRCPGCRREKPNASRLNPWERAITLLFPVRPVRCQHCHWRYRIWAPRVFEWRRTLLWVVVASLSLTLLVTFGLGAKAGDRASVSQTPAPNPELTEAIPGRTDGQGPVEGTEAEADLGVDRILALRSELDGARRAQRVADEARRELRQSPETEEGGLDVVRAKALALRQTLRQYVESLTTELAAARREERESGARTARRNEGAEGVQVQELRERVEALTTELAAARQEESEIQMARRDTSAEERRTNAAELADDAEGARAGAAPPSATPSAPSSASTLPAKPADSAILAVTGAVRRWADAWSGQVVDDYLAAYSSRFRPARGISRSAWMTQRRERLSRPSFIKVGIDRLQIQFEGTELAKAVFQQAYQDETYRDAVTKTLVFEREDGAWKIVEERAGG